MIFLIKGLLQMCNALIIKQQQTHHTRIINILEHNILFYIDTRLCSVFLVYLPDGHHLANSV